MRHSVDVNSDKLIFWLPRKSSPNVLANDNNNDTQMCLIMMTESDGAINIDSKTFSTPDSIKKWFSFSLSHFTAVEYSTEVPRLRRNKIIARRDRFI